MKATLWTIGLGHISVIQAPAASGDRWPVYMLLARCPQLAARDFFSDVEHAVLGRLRVPLRLWNMNGTPARYRMPSPLLGQHNDVLYGTLGLDDDSIARLRADAVIWAPRSAASW